MWARKQSLPAIGEPRNLLLKGTNKPLEDLIGGVKHGLLITNLWYLRLIQSESMLFTGVTRDGVFLIQDGKAVQPVRDFRFNISALQILSNITDLSCSARTFCYEPGLERVDVPALLTKGLKIVGEVST
jgi:predicted Zn-dependent protease